MWVKEAKGTVQIYTSSYDSTKKRNVARMVGSLDPFDLPQKVPVELAQKLKDVEVQQLQEWLSSHRKHADFESNIYAWKSLAWRLNKASKHGVPSEIGKENADEIYAGMAAIAKALKKAGFTKPTASERSARAPAVHEGQASLLPDEQAEEVGAGQASSQPAGQGHGVSDEQAQKKPAKRARKPSARTKKS